MKSIFISNKTWKRGLLLLALFLSGFSLQIAAQSYNWKSVRIGGCGRVTSIKPHPKVTNLFFITTDVGTPYRWNNASQRWEDMMLGVKMPTTYWNWQNNQLCGEVAFDPNDATGNILYATVSNGKGSVPGGGSDQLGTVMKSVDRGNTWTDCGLQIFVAPNNDQMSTDRLVVDPQNSNIIYLTTKSNGTYRSDLAGAHGSWVKQSTPFDALSGRFLKFDISGGVVNGVTKNIFIGTVNGIYRSTNGGVSFSLMSGGPKDVRRASISNDGILYVTTTPTSTNGAIQKWNGNYWSTVSPDASLGYKAIAVNPFNSNEVLTASAGTWYHDRVYRTTTGGVSGGWTPMNLSRDNSDAPHSIGGDVTNAGHNIDMFCFDPLNAGHAWFSDMTDVAQTTDVWAATVNWKLRDAGLEEVIVTGQLVCPTSGRNLLLSSTGDVGGFDHQSLIDPPQKGMASFFYTDRGINISGVAVQYNDPNFIVRVGSDGWDGPGKGGYSEDGGLSYHSFATIPSKAVRGRVAVSATNRNIVWVSQGGATYTSSDKGTSWVACSGVINDVLKYGTLYTIYPGQTPVAADKVSGNIFYIYARGIIYVSQDGGLTFSARASDLPSDYGSASNACIATTPGISGDLWYAHEKGLYHSVDTAKTFIRVNAEVVGSPKWVTVGKADTTATSNPVVYVTSDNNSINGIAYGIFRSVDNGNTWTTISENTPGIVLNMAADLHGRVFLGINGNGIFVGEPVGGQVTGVTITQTSNSININDSLMLKAAFLPVYPANSAVSWSSSDSSIATVDSNGLVKGKKNGMALITVTTQDGGLTANSTINVTPIVHVTDVSLVSDVYIALGGSTNLMVNVLPVDSKNKKVNWSSSDTTIVKVNASGLINAVGLGDVTINATTVDNSITASSVIHVSTTANALNVGDNTNSYGNFKRDPVYWDWTSTTTSTMAIDMSAITNPAPEAVYQSQRNNMETKNPYYLGGLIPNSSYTLRLHFAELAPTVKYGTKKFDIVINNKDTVLKMFDIYSAAGGKLYKAVVKEFPVTATSSGSVSVKFVRHTGTSSINGIELVLNSLTSVTLDKDSAFVGVGDTTRLTATMVPVGVTNKGISWKSSNQNVATVSATGLVTAMGNGTAIITVTTVEGGKTATAIITVASFTKYEAENAIISGGIIASDHIGYSGTGFWANASVQGNSIQFRVNASAGTQDIACRYSNGTVGTRTLSLYVNNIKIRQISCLPTTGWDAWTDQIDNVTLKEGNNTIKYQYDSGDNGQISIDYLSVGTTTNVAIDSVSVSPVSSILIVGSTLQLSATVLPTNAFNKVVTWSTSNESIATVSSSGLVTAVGSGTATITVTTVDGSMIANSIIKVTTNSNALIIDNTSAEFTGTWTSSTWMQNYYGTNYVYHATTATNPGIGENKVRWRPDIISEGEYSVSYRLPDGDKSRITNAPFTVYFNGGSHTYLVNEQAVSGGAWILLGTHNFSAGTTGYVELTDSTNTINVIADAIKWVYGGVVTSVSSISISPFNSTLAVGGTQQLIANVLPSNATYNSVTWSSSNDSITTVSSSGLVTAIASGTATITATTVDGGKTDFAVITNTSTGLFDKSANASLSIVIYPNPTSQDHFIVKLRGYEDENSVELLMTDLSGRLLYNDKIQTEGYSERIVRISALSLNKGLYIMSVISQNTKKDMKLIVN